MYTAVLLLILLGLLLSILLGEVVPILLLDQQAKRLEREEVVGQRRIQGLDERPKLPAIGTAGRTATPLRPVGKVTVADDTWEASAESRIIDAGEDIRVVGHRGGTLIVRPAG